MLTKGTDAMPLFNDIGKDWDKGGFRPSMKDWDKGLPDQTASAGTVTNELFQRASQLGGFFVVGFIAPVGPSVGANGQTAKQQALINLAMEGLSEQLKAQTRQDSEPAAQGKTDYEAAASS
jgi:hypothetical protein